MKLSRRGFLKSSAAAPIAARAVASSIATEIEAASGVGSIGRMAYGYGAQPMAPPMADHEAEHNRIEKMLGLFRNGIPSWKKRQYRRRARYTRTLDPDIASMRSISLTHKLSMQWRREEVRAEQEEIEELQNRRDSTSWFRRMGIDYW